ncbi:MAG: YggS family pyridoxal phosphate-dependent enzyme [Clostridia bacterium]|nr:YggS family pyridoxal phosphate-dependent enzyme [Clostridia bacterium]
MMEKLSAEEFDLNFKAVNEKLDVALKKAGKTRDDVILLAATKTVDVDTINYAINKGINYIGENKVQELLSKQDGIIDVHHHFIGHLQTNKVKDIIDRVELIHSVDSLKLAKEISKQAVKKNKVMDILLEVNIGDEESKWGFEPNELESAIKEIAALENLRVCGIMAIPPICNEPEQNRKYFKQMQQLFIDIKNKNIDNCFMNILSMGMSDDFDIAIEEGANLVRVGTALFGKRYYIK